MSGSAVFFLPFFLNLFLDVADICIEELYNDLIVNVHSLLCSWSHTITRVCLKMAKYVFVKDLIEGVFFI